MVNASTFATQLNILQKATLAKAIHEFMDIDVLCDAKTFELEARINEVESIP